MCSLVMICLFSATHTFINLTVFIILSLLKSATGLCDCLDMQMISLHLLFEAHPSYFCLRIGPFGVS